MVGSGWDEHVGWGLNRGLDTHPPQSCRKGGDWVHKVQAGTGGSVCGPAHDNLGTFAPDYGPKEGQRLASRPFAEAQWVLISSCLVPKTPNVVAPQEGTALGVAMLPLPSLRAYLCRWRPQQPAFCSLLP